MSWRWVAITVAGVAALAASATAFYVLTLYPAEPPQRGRLALVGAAVLIGDDLEPVRDATVLVADGVIITLWTSRRTRTSSMLRI